MLPLGNLWHMDRGEQLGQFAISLFGRGVLGFHPLFHRGVEQVRLPEDADVVVAGDRELKQLFVGEPLRRRAAVGSGWREEPASRRR